MSGGSEASEQASSMCCDARDAEPPAVVALENTERSAVEVTLVSARERREPRTELASSGSNENLAEPEQENIIMLNLDWKNGEIHMGMKVGVFD